MHSPLILWPLAWWTALAAVALIMGVPFLIARARVARCNRNLSRLRPRLRELGLPMENGAFSIGEGKNLFAVDGERFAVGDLKRWDVVQTLSLEEALSLKIYDDNSDRIHFRIVLHGGAQTRKVSTRSIAEFGRLFILFGRAGKPVEYISA
jgi:hypothetical protein